MEKRTIVPLVAFVFSLAVTCDATSYAGTSGSTQALPNRERERERLFFEQRHFPYGASIPTTVLRDMWNKIEKMPSETAGSSTAWKCIGPFGADLNYTASGLGRYMGRVLDVEVNPGIGTRFAAASGGLWGYSFVFPEPLSDQLTSLAIGSFDSKPEDPNTIIVGTGEGQAPRSDVRSGTGAFKTTNRGATWKLLPTPGIPSSFYRIRYDPDIPGRVHAVSSLGYMRSDDDGEHWKTTTGGMCTDIAFARKGDIRLICITQVGNGLLLSEDGGDTWKTVQAANFPPGNFGRGAVTASAPEPATGRSSIYVSFGMNTQPDNLLGIYRSTDAGESWTVITPSITQGVGQLSYNHTLAVCPTDSRLLLAGYVTMLRSSDGGDTWASVDNLNPLNHDNMHGDFHALTWSADGKGVWAGNDGGISTSFDGGITWTSPINNVPITQFYGIDVGVADNSVIWGGSQDNGAIGTTDGGANWFGSLCCDAGSPSIDPNTNARIYCVMNGTRYRSTNLGVTWSVIDNGLGPVGVLRTDGGGNTLPVKTAPLVYTTTAYNVFYSTNFGNNWITMTPTPLPAGINDLEVPRENITGGPEVVAVMDGASPGTVLKLYFKGAWYEISTGFPPAPPKFARVQKVRMWTGNTAVFCAVMAGADPASDGKKVFISTDVGLHWTNITGNLPNIPLADVVIDPDDRNNLYLGTDMGCFRTWDGGHVWYRWNDGMPQANIITEMRPTYIDGKLWIVAGTYGRSIWMRPADASDPSRLDYERKGISTVISDNLHAVDTVNATGPAPKGKVLKVRVRLDSLTHPNVNDLVIVLRHNGVEDTLVNRLSPPGSGGTANFISTTFDDDAPIGPGRVAAPFTGTYQPMQPLSIFAGMSAEGPWILDVYDAQAGNTGMLEGWSLAVDAETPTSVVDDASVPTAVTLSQNFPNPFNPSTTIRYGLPTSSPVSLIVYDCLGQEVARLANGMQGAGVHEVRFNAAGLASGVYLYRLVTGDFVQTRKLLLLR